jgi:antitoxin (DNA-binding transcriptional repressor) of toxin-antitoxin stability system
MSDRYMNIHDAKTHLSRCLSELGPADRLVICRRNRPVAEARLLAAPTGSPRPLGLARGELTVTPEFFERLPDGVLDDFGLQM